MPNITKKCPECGGINRVNPDAQSVKCAYCGEEFDVRGKSKAGAFGEIEDYEGYEKGKDKPGFAKGDKVYNRATDSEDEIEDIDEDEEGPWYKMKGKPDYYHETDVRHAGVGIEQPNAGDRVQFINREMDIDAEGVVVGCSAGVCTIEVDDAYASDIEHLVSVSGWLVRRGGKLIATVSIGDVLGKIGRRYKVATSRQKVAMVLLTKEILDAVPPLYSQDGKGMDALVYAKFFTPDSNWTWLMTEYDPVNREAFGYVQGFEGELGYFSIDELESARGPMGLPIERDMSFPVGVKTLRESISSEHIGSWREQPRPTLGMLASRPRRKAFRFREDELIAKISSSEDIKRLIEQ